MHKAVGWALLRGNLFIAFPVSSLCWLSVEAETFHGRLSTNRRLSKGSTSVTPSPYWNVPILNRQSIERSKQASWTSSCAEHWCCVRLLFCGGQTVRLATQDRRCAPKFERLELSRLGPHSALISIPTLSCDNGGLEKMPHPSAWRLALLQKRLAEPEIGSCVIFNAYICLPSFPLTCSHHIHRKSIVPGQKCRASTPVK